LTLSSEKKATRPQMCVDLKALPLKDLHMRQTGVKEEDSIAEAEAEEAANLLEDLAEKKRTLKRRARTVDEVVEEEEVAVVTGAIGLDMCDVVATVAATRKAIRPSRATMVATKLRRPGEDGVAAVVATEADREVAASVGDTVAGSAGAPVSEEVVEHSAVVLVETFEVVAVAAVDRWAGQKAERAAPKVNKQTPNM